jgi:hypothetical protein
MNKIGMDKYWLGLYWRNNKYDISFLKEMCELCSENKIGKISITPWKSFVVKGIPRESKLVWEKVFREKRDQCTSLNVRIELAFTSGE